MADINEVWNTVSASPNCPSLSDVMEQIKSITHRGMLSRAEVTHAVVSDTFHSTGARIDDQVRSEMASVIWKHFPNTIYVAKVSHTLDVFKRRNAPVKKYSERIFHNEISLIKANSANLSRSISPRIDNLLQEHSLAQKTKRSRKLWSAAVAFARSTLGFVFTIIAGVLVVAIAAWYGLGG